MIKNAKFSKKQICIISPSLRMGGIERALTVLANEWALQNYDVIYVSCLKSEHFYILNSKIKIVEPSFKRSTGLFNKLLFYPKLINYIRTQIKFHQPNVILSFGDLFNPLVLIAGLGLGIPIYISDRTSPDFRFPSYIKILKQIMYPKAAGFIAQTQIAFDAKLVQFGHGFRQVVIPNAIRAIEKLDVEREKIILYVGRFSWEKNPIALIEAFHKIQNKDDWTLVMAGDGPQLQEMKEKAKELKIEKSIIFLGVVTRLDEWLNKASIFVLPSILEGFSNALAEAMTAGLPVICFETIAYESMITPNLNGVVVPIKTELLASSISDLMHDKQKRVFLGKNALEKSKEWNVKGIIEKYAEFIKLYE